MHQKSLLLTLFGEQPLFKIIDFFIDNMSADFSKKQIAEGAQVSRASLFLCWPEIEKYGIVTVTRSFGKTKLYTLNTKSPIVKRLLELEKTLIEEAIEKDAAAKREKVKISSKHLGIEAVTSVGFSSLE